VAMSTSCASLISPCCKRFKSFVDVPPKEFCAVNKERFSANGKSKLVVDVSGGVNYSQLCLTEVLHPPEVGFTPVSISRRDEEGSSVTQDGGKCIV